MWALKKWSLNTGGLLLKGACIVWLSFGTLVAQDRWSLNTSGHKTGFTVVIFFYNFFPNLVLVFFY